MAKAQATADTDMCTETVCTDVPPEPRSIVGGAGASPTGHDDVVEVVEEEPKRYSVAAAGGEIFANDSPHNPPANHGLPTHGPRQHMHHQELPVRDITTTSSWMPFLLVAVLGVSLAWLYFKQRKQQKEWSSSSDAQLEMIRQRNIRSAVCGEQPAPKMSSMSNDQKLENHEVDYSKGKVGSCDAHQEILSTENLVGKGEAALSPKTDPAQSICGKKASKPKPPDHLSKIRAKQQEQLQRNAKLTREQKKTKKQIIHSSFNHDAADEAYERRRKVIIAEEESLFRKMQLREQQRAQQQLQEEQDRAQLQALNELEQMERMAILQQQDMEYQEALMRDQERARQQALQNETKLRRARVLEQAKQRLVAAGVQNNSGITRDEDTKEAFGDEHTIKVRLLFPSGRRVEGSFDAHHAMGLVYDLALIVLDREHLLWSQEDDGRDRKREHGMEDSSHEIIGATDHDSCSYNDTHKEWKQIFHSFSLVSTFPPQSFDNLSIQLGECGIGGSAMLMVVVDSD